MKIIELLGGESKIQSLRFPNDKYNSEKARKWMKKYNIKKPLKRVKKTENYLEYRLLEPIKKKGYIYRTKKFGSVLAVLFIKDDGRK